MPFAERKEVLESIKYIDSVYTCVDMDMTVCKTLEILRPTYFANGGDRGNTNTPEVEVCKELGIEMRGVS